MFRSVTKMVCLMVFLGSGLLFAATNTDIDLVITVPTCVCLGVSGDPAPLIIQGPATAGGAFIDDTDVSTQYLLTTNSATSQQIRVKVTELPPSTKLDIILGAETMGVAVPVTFTNADDDDATWKQCLHSITAGYETTDSLTYNFKPNGSLVPTTTNHLTTVTFEMLDE